jgi:hypothetical protein
MPRLTAAVASALADWWPLALSAGFGGFQAGDLQSAARDIAADNDITLPFSAYTSLATLYGYARRMSNASGAVHAADDADYIASEHIAIPPWARDEQAQNASPIWHVQYQFTYLDENGVQQSEYKTSVFEYPSPFPDTIGGLREAINGDAQVLADKYGVQLLNVELHQILAV